MKLIKTDYLFIFKKNWFFNIDISNFSEVPGESAETKAELQALNDTHPNEWNMHMVELFFKHHLKWSDSQSVQAAEKIKSGRVNKVKKWIIFLVLTVDIKLVIYLILNMEFTLQKNVINNLSLHLRFFLEPAVVVFCGENIQKMISASCLEVLLARVCIFFRFNFLIDSFFLDLNFTNIISRRLNIYIIIHIIAMT